MSQIEKWDKSFSDVVEAMSKLQKSDEEKKATPRYFFVNPVVGPEPLTGSTRMKGLFMRLCLCICVV